MNEILVLYYSKSGSVKELASFIARGINSVEGAEAKIRTVPEIFPEINTIYERKLHHKNENCFL